MGEATVSATAAIFGMTTAVGMAAAVSGEIDAVGPLPLLIRAAKPISPMVPAISIHHNRTCLACVLAAGSAR